VLVNEFGALGIDGALLEAASSSSGDSSSNRVAVKEMAGGCLCCTLSGPLAMAVPQLIRQTKPDRLFIEPSGLGHPSKLLELLQGEHLRSSLEIMSVICLLDMRAVNQEVGGDSTYQSQIDVADVLVGSFVDVSSPEEISSFHCMASELFPPKQIITASLSGSGLDVQRLFGPILDLPRDQAFTTLFKLSSQAPQLIQVDQRSREALWASGLPCRYISSSGSKVEAVGWSFDPSFTFKQRELTYLCRDLSPLTGKTLRLKGIVKLEAGGFKSIKYRASGEVDFEELTLPLTDFSRIEIILSQNHSRDVHNEESDTPADVQAIITAILRLDFETAEKGMVGVLGRGLSLANK